MLSRNLPTRLYKIVGNEDQSNLYALIGGHTDDVGSEEYNQVLSEKRRLGTALPIEHGVEEFIASKGYGKQCLLPTIQLLKVANLTAA